MPNIFQRGFQRVAQLFGRGEPQQQAPQPEQQQRAPEAPQQPPVQPEQRQAPQPEQQERGFFGRVWDRVTGADRRREVEQREQAIQQREQELAQREQQVRQVEQQIRQVEQQIRQQQEPQVKPQPSETQQPTESQDRSEQIRQDIQSAMVHDREARQQERDRRDEQRQASIERDKEKAAQRQPEQPHPALAKFKPVQGIGPKGSLGTIYTDATAAAAMRHIDAAANVEGRRMSLRVLKSDGTWREMFKERGRKSSRGIRADYLKSKIDDHGGGDLGGWIAGGCTGISGDYEGDDILDDAVGFQVVEHYDQ